MRGLGMQPLGELDNIMGRVGTEFDHGWPESAAAVLPGVGCKLYPSRVQAATSCWFRPNRGSGRHGMGMQTLGGLDNILSWVGTEFDRG